MRHFGLIGKQLSHSFSKSFFQKKFSAENIEACYNNFEIEDKIDLLDFLHTTNCEGLNITIPYKKEILQYIQNLTPEAQAIQAVNCIKQQDNNWLGHNTDCIGFEKTLDSLVVPENSKAIVLGNGGGAQSVFYVLKKKNIPFIVISRRLEQNTFLYQDINEKIISDYKLIINTTPLGMFPNIEHFPPLPYSYLTAENVLVDLIYNPTETIFLKKGREFGASTYNGLLMLEEQAKAAWDFWNE